MRPELDGRIEKGSKICFHNDFIFASKPSNDTNALFVFQEVESIRINRVSLDEPRRLLWLLIFTALDTDGVLYTVHHMLLYIAQCEENTSVTGFLRSKKDPAGRSPADCESVTTVGSEENRTKEEDAAVPEPLRCEGVSSGHNETMRCYNAQISDLFPGSRNGINTSERRG